MEFNQSIIDKSKDEKTPLPKLMILGYGRHGKDTVADYLVAHYGYKSISSSLFAAEKVVYPVLKEQYGYTTVEECYDDRHNHRAEWYNLIAAYNTPDGARLARDLYRQYGIYVGIRNPVELQALKDEKAFEWCIWVDRSKHQPPEPTDSCGVTELMANITIDNNGSLQDLYACVDELMAHISVTKQQ